VPAALASANLKRSTDKESVSRNFGEPVFPGYDGGRTLKMDLLTASE
jgi:hypothetical protein